MHWRHGQVMQQQLNTNKRAFQKTGEPFFDGIYSCSVSIPDKTGSPLRRLPAKLGFIFWCHLQTGRSRGADAGRTAILKW